MKNLNSLSKNPNEKRKKERKEKKRKRKEKMSTTTTTTLQELLQFEEDSFIIPDEMDDKLSDDNTYNWEVMFETVKLFLMKEGGGRDVTGKRTCEM